MTEVNINIKDNQNRFFAGDVVSGRVNLVLGLDEPLSNVTVSFHCLGEVKWVEYPRSLHYLDGFVYYDQIGYHEAVAKWTEDGEWSF